LVIKVVGQFDSNKIVATRQVHVTSRAFGVVGDFEDCAVLEGAFHQVAAFGFLQEVRDDLIDSLRSFCCFNKTADLELDVDDLSP
jgi:hypothetical protein